MEVALNGISIGQRHSQKFKSYPKAKTMVARMVVNCIFAIFVLAGRDCKGLSLKEWMGWVGLEAADAIDIIKM
jgi:hypothetical protein